MLVTPKSDPRPYQWRFLEEHAYAPGWMLAWQPGVGKTKPLIDNAAELWLAKLIDAVIVLAPNGVHYNWVDHELPKHCPVPYRAHAFDNARDTDRSKTHARAMADALEPTEGVLPWLALSYHALLKESMVDVPGKGERSEAKGGRLYDLVRDRRCLIIGDELVTIKDPKGRMSRAARALAKLCPFRRGADGTPVDKGAFDVYSQVLFLDHRYWEKRGLGSCTAFENQYGVFRPLNVTVYDTDKSTGRQTVRMRYNKETKAREPVKPQVLKEYKNLPELREHFAGIATRLTKEDAGLHLPPKTYVYQPFELTPGMRREYERMKKEYMVEIDGKLITAPMAMTRLLRLQQITSGYLPTDPDGGSFVEIDKGKNPRLDALCGLTDTLTEQGLLWATFRADRDKIMDALGDRVICYRSGDSDDQKRECIDRWRRGDSQWLLGHVNSGLARGHTLVEGTVAVYYQNLFRHAPRLQSEDRIHRIGQHCPVTYYDLHGRRTIDRKVVDSLIYSQEVAAEVLGDVLADWLGAEDPA